MVVKNNSCSQCHILTAVCDVCAKLRLLCVFLFLFILLTTKLQWSQPCRFDSTKCPKIQNGLIVEIKKIKDRVQTKCSRWRSGMLSLCGVGMSSATRVPFAEFRSWVCCSWTYFYISVFHDCFMPLVENINSHIETAGIKCCDWWSAIYFSL